MQDSIWWTGVLGGTAAWLTLFSYPGLAEVAGRDLFLPVLLGLGPVVAFSIYMDLRTLSLDAVDWQPRTAVYVAPALLFPAVVGPLYLFFRLLYVEMQDDEDGRSSRGSSRDTGADESDGSGGGS